MNWSHFPEECLWYLVPMSILHVAIFCVGYSILVTLAKLRRQRENLGRRVANFGLFLVLFLFVSSGVNGLWSCLIYGRLYRSLDYVFDFIPFWPICWRRVDTPWGDGHGELFTSLSQLNFVWLLFAVGTWAATIVIYRNTSRHLPPRIYKSVAEEEFQ